MKKILSLILILFLTCGISFAKNKKSALPSYKFNGGVYHLYYSAKNDDSGGYINEYYKADQSYTSWKDLVAFWHYPNAYSPIDQAKEYKELLSSEGIPVSIEVNEEDNTAIIDFTMIASKKLPIVLEYNIFKFAKHEKCGSVGFQYAKRYRVNDSFGVDKVKKDINKHRKKLIKKVNSAEFTEIYTDNIDEGKLKVHEGVDKSYDKEFK